MSTTSKRRAQLAREDALRAAYAWREQVEQHGGDVMGSRSRAMLALTEWVRCDREARGVVGVRVQAPISPPDVEPAAYVDALPSTPDYALNIASARLGGR